MVRVLVEMPGHAGLTEERKYKDAQSIELAGEGRFMHIVGPGQALIASINTQRVVLVEIE